MFLARHAGPALARRTLTPLLSAGPLSELHYPIDGLTKKPKGFAFVTFMFPEHAVRAYAEVDGQVFQVSAHGGRGCWAQVMGKSVCGRVCACARMSTCTHVLGLRRCTQWCANHLLT